MDNKRGLIPLEKLLRMDRKGVIVTGGAVGIGRGIVYRFAEAVRF